MLRRYSSRGVETVNIESRRTIGNKNCDINVEGVGVCSPHVAIELHPFTRTYWLRELSLTGSTTVNGRQINGQVELHSGDLIRIGSAQPLVFEEGSIFPIRKISSEMSHKSFEPINNGILPVLGHRMEPQHSAQRNLNGSRNSSSQRISRPKRTAHHLTFRDKRLHATAVTPNSMDSRSSPASIDSNSEMSPRAANTNGVLGSVASVGNSLLQRVVRLQSEVSRKDEEILTLLHRLRSFEDQFPKQEKRGSLFKEPVKRQSLNTVIPAAFELEAYRSFIHVLSQKLHKFNECVLSHPHKDYSDVFLKFSRSLEEPFSVKMTEIEEDCRNELHGRGFDEIQLSRLRPFLTDDHREHISRLGHEIEALFPVVRDATAIARESISVCTVFTQWSRHLGDSLRAQGLKSSLLHHAIDQLKEQFAQSEMRRHWLPPSVAPLFRLIALETEKKESRRERDTQTDYEREGWTPLPTDERIRLVRSAELGSAPPETNELGNLITEAEKKTVQLQGDIESLSDSIRQQLEMDKATEHHLESLCSVLGSIKETLQIFTEENDKTARKESILSVEVKEEDLKEGLLKQQESLRSELSGPHEQKLVVQESKDDVSMWEGAVENLRDKLFSLLETAPSPKTEEYVVVRKYLLEDIMYASQVLHDRLSTEKDSDKKADGIEQAKVTVEMSSPGMAEAYNEPVKERLRVDKEEERVKREASMEDEVFVEQKGVDENLEEVKEEEQHSSVVATPRTSVTSLGVISSEEYVKHGEELDSPRPEKKLGEEEEAPVKQEHVSEKLVAEVAPQSQVPAIVQQSPSPIERQTSALGSGLNVQSRPKSARPRSSFDPKQANGNVVMGNGPVKKIPPALSLEDKAPESFEIPVKPLEEGERKDWSSEGTFEEVSLGTTVDLATPSPTVAPIPEEEPPTEEELLMETRRRVTDGLADSIFNSEKPKSICDYSHSAHIQSHINTATKHPVSYTKIPVNTFDFFNSPPSTKKKVKIEEKPPLRQPRMQFKLN